MFTLDKLKENWKVYAGWMLAMMIVAGLSAWVSKERTSVKVKEEVREAFYVQVTLTAKAETRVSELLRQVEHLSKTSKDSNKSLKKTLRLCGGVPCELNGQALYDTEEVEGLRESTENLVTELNKMSETHSEHISVLHAQIEFEREARRQAESKTSKAGLKAWGATFTYDPPLYNLGSAGNLGASLGPNVHLGGITLHPQAGLVAPDMDFTPDRLRARFSLGASF